MENGSFIPIIFFVLVTYLFGFFKWGLFYEKDVLTIIIMGCLFSIFSLFLAKKQAFTIDNFFLKFKDKKILILFCLNFLFIFVSIFFSTYKYASLIYALKFLLVTAFFIFGMLFSTKTELKKIFFELYNIITWVLALWVLLGSVYLTYFAYKPGIPNFLIRGLATLAAGGLNKNLLGSIFGYPNTLATFLGCFIFVTFFFFLKEKNINKKALQLLKLVILVLGFQLTQSRASFLLLILCVGVVSLFLLFEEGKKNKKLAFIILFFLIIFLGVLLFAPARAFVSAVIFPKTLQGMEEYSVRDRINLIKDGLNYFLKNPIFGTGGGTYEYNFYLYRTQLSANVPTTDPHSFLITEMGEMGIIGTLLMLLLVGGLELRIFKARKREDSAYLFLVFAIIFGLLHAFIDWDWLFLLPLLNFGLLFGFVYGGASPALARAEEQKEKKFFNFKIVFAILIFVALLSSCLLIARSNFEKIRISEKTTSYFAYKLVPFNLDYAMLKASLAAASGKDSPLVREAFEKATKIIPKYFLPWRNYTNYLLSLEGGGAPAVATATKLVALSPYNYASNYLLAQTYYLGKAYEKTKEFSQKALAMNPEDLASEILLGEAEVALKEPEAAIANLLIAYGKESSNKATLIALFDAYGLLKNTEKQLYFLGKSIAGGPLVNDPDILQRLKTIAPAAVFTNVNQNRQYNINEDDIFKVTWEIKGVNLKAASEVSLAFENLQTGQRGEIGVFELSEKAYEFVLTPGSYRINLCLRTAVKAYKNSLGRDWINTSTMLITVVPENPVTITEDKMVLLKRVALENVKVSPFYFPAHYVLARLAKDKKTAYEYLVKAFNEQGSSKGDENIYAALNNFIQFSSFKGIEETSIQKEAPITFLFDEKNLDIKLFSEIDFFLEGKAGNSQALGNIYTKNIVAGTYVTFLRTWNLAPGKYQIYCYLINTYIRDNNLVAPRINFTLNIEKSELKIEDLGTYLTIIDNSLTGGSEDGAALNYLRGVFEKAQGEKAEAGKDFEKAYAKDPTLFEAKEQYLALYPQTSTGEVKLKKVAYQDIYSGMPFIAQWEVSNKDALTWTNGITFLLLDKTGTKYYLLAEGEVVKQSLISENLDKAIPAGTYRLVFSTLNKNPKEKYTEKDLATLTRTNYYITLYKTEMPKSLNLEEYLVGTKYYEEGPAPDYALAYWLGSLALKNKDYKMLTYYFNICINGGNKAEYCSQILKQMNLPEIGGPWVGYNGSYKNEIYMPLEIGFIEKTTNQKLLPLGYKVEILETKTLKVLQTFEISDYTVWSDATIFTSVFSNLPENNYYLRLTIDKIKDGRALKIVAYHTFVIVKNNLFVYTKEALDYFEALARKNPKGETFNCILARINFYKNDYDKAIKYAIAAQKEGYENCLEPESIWGLLKELDTVNTLVWEKWTITIKNISYSGLAESKNLGYKFLDILVRNNKNEAWSYLDYKREKNTIILAEDEKNKNFNENSEYIILVQDIKGNMLFLPTSMLVKD